MASLLGAQVPPWVADAAFYAGLAGVALLDLRTRRVPNAVSVGLLVVGLLTRLLLEGTPGLLSGLGGAGVGFALLIVPFALRLVGGADVKVMTAIGAWLTPVGALAAAGLGFVVGGLMAIALVLARPELRRSVRANLWTALLTREAPQVEERPRALSVPHVTAYAIGGVIVRVLGWGL